MVVRDHFSSTGVIVRYCHVINKCSDTGCSLNIVRTLESLQPFSRQNSAAIGCIRNYQPIGKTYQPSNGAIFPNILYMHTDGQTR